MNPVLRRTSADTKKSWNNICKISYQVWKYSQRQSQSAMMQVHKCSYFHLSTGTLVPQKRRSEHDMLHASAMLQTCVAHWHQGSKRIPQDRHTRTLFSSPPCNHSLLRASHKSLHTNTIKHLSQPIFQIAEGPLQDLVTSTYRTYDNVARSSKNGPSKGSSKIFMP